MFITLDEIFEEFEDLDPRDQSQYLLEIGYELPRFEDNQKRDEDLVHGCQSQVWLTAAPKDGAADPVLQISADSDAEIVRGLITILLASYEGLTASQVAAYPITDVFDRLHLRQYISPQRHNGLQGMVDRIRNSAIALSGTHSDVPKGEQAGVSVTVKESRAGAETDAPFDAESIRAEFPVLNQLIDGQRPIFLDSGASAQKPKAVIDKEREVQEGYFANAYRGRHAFGARIDEELEASRKRIAAFINAPSERQIVFTPGTTATLNMVAAGWGDRFTKPGDEILITEMEHHANFVPWQQLAKRAGATLRFIPLTDDGRLDMSRLDEVLSKKTRLVAVCGMSNVLGTVNPIAELTRAAHDVGAVIVVDGAQSVPHMKSDVQADDVDFLIFSGHKLYGPTGVGVLYGREDRLEEMEPVLFGGHMIDRVFKDHSTWAPPPAKFEAGTLPIVQAIALGTAVEWSQNVGIDRIHAHEQSLLQLAWDQLTAIPNMQIYGPGLEHRGGILSFRMHDVHPEDLAALLDRKAIMTRHGHHCAMPLHDLLGVSATTRASFAAYNTAEDVSALVAAIMSARQILRRN